MTTPIRQDQTELFFSCASSNPIHTESADWITTTGNIAEFDAKIIDLHEPHVGLAVTNVAIEIGDQTKLAQKCSVQTNS